MGQNRSYHLKLYLSVKNIKGEIISEKRGFNKKKKKKTRQRREKRKRAKKKRFLKQKTRKYSQVQKGGNAPSKKL